MDPTDPATADSLDDLAACLKHVHLRAGRPTYRALEQETIHDGGPLPGTRFKRARLTRSIVSDALLGRKLPGKAFLLTFVAACGVDLENDHRWEDAWDRVAARHYQVVTSPPSAEEETGRLVRENEELRQQLAALRQAAAPAATSPVASAPDEERPEPIHFRLLGPFQMTVGGRPQGLPPHEALMLAVLLEARAPVTDELLSDAIWGDHHPPQGGLKHVAATLRASLRAAGHSEVLIRGSRGYQLALPSNCVDVHRFRALVDRASHLPADEKREALRLLGEAVSLHRGEPLAGMRGLWADNHRQALVRERHAAELALQKVLGDILTYRRPVERLVSGRGSASRAASARIGLFA